nr:autotransporter-associated beta strand repeat-containing protein [Comamonas sp. Tr-654]
MLVAAAALLTAAFGSDAAFAACSPVAPPDGSTVTCTGTVEDYAAIGNNLIFNISSGTLVTSSIEGVPSMSLIGTGITVNNNSIFDPIFGKGFSVATSALKMQGIGASNLVINNNASAFMRGASGNLGASLANMDGMAIEVSNTPTGLTTIVNNGTITSIALAGATEADALRPVVAVYGGGRVEMSNTYQIYGRVAFETSALGNLFTNSGAVYGSVSLGANSSNQFIAITGSSISNNGASGPALGNSAGIDLEFAAPGIVDGGANGNNTLTLRNTVNSGATGTGTLSSAVYTNFSNLVIQSGTWNVTGPLLTGATTSARLEGGALVVNNGGFAGSGTISALGGTMSSSGSLLTLANNIELRPNVPAGTSGLTLNGSNAITLNGVISGTAGLTKNGGHVLRINGVNTYSGGTNLNGGTTIVGTNEAFGTGAINTGSAGARIDSSAVVNLANTINLGGTLILGGTSTLTLDGNVLGTTNQLSKVGLGNLVLNGTNTFQGGLLLSSGTLTVGNDQALGSGTLTVGATTSLNSNKSVTLANAVTLNSNLNVSGNNDLRLNGAITGSTSVKLTKTGTGNLTLGGSNSGLLSDIDLNAGTLTVASSGALGSGTLTATGNSRLAVTSAQTISSAMTVNNGVTLDFNTTAATTHNGGILGTGTLAKTGSADLLLTTANNFTGNWDVREGSLTTTAVNALGSDPGLNVASGASVNLGGNTDLTTLSGSGQVNTDSRVAVGYANVSSTFNGQITGQGSLLKVGSGTLTLGGINTYTGSTTINVGRVNVAAGASLASNLVTVSTGGTLGGSGTVNAVTVGIGGRLALSSGSTLTTGSLTLSNGAILDLALGAPTLRPMLNIIGNLSITASTFNITDAGGLANGNYRLLNYSGNLTGTNLTAGSTPSDLLSTDIGRVFDIAGKTLTLVINSPTLGTQYWDGNNPLANGVINGGSGIWSSSASNWTKSDGNTNEVWAGKTAAFAGSTGVVLVQGQQSVNALQFKTDGYVLVQGAAGALDLVNGTGGTASVVTDTGVSAQIATNITGTGKLTKSGAGTLILSGSNSYSGGTVLSAGTLAVRSDSALGTGNLVLGSGTTLVADSFPPSLNNALVTNGVSTLQVSVSRLTLGGDISGAGGLIKTGSGTLVLNGSNNMLGNFNLIAGGLIIGNGLALGSGSLVTSSGTTLDASLPGVTVDNNVVINGDLTFLGNRDMSLGGVISGTGNLIHNGGNALNLTGASTFDGTLTLKGGTLRLGQNTSLGNAQLNVTGAATLQSAANISVANAVDLGAMLTVVGSNDLNLGGVVTGAGNLRKSGTGTLTLSGNNQARTGDTEVDNGTLRLGHANALGSGKLNVNGIATVESSSALTVSNAVDVSGVMTVGGSNDLTLSGVLSGSGGLTKAGSSTLTLGGVNTFDGTYQVSAGRLVSSVVTGLGASSQVNVASGATLQIVQGGSIGRLDGAGAVQLDAGNFSVGAGSFGGAFSGSGSLVKTGTGILRLNGNSTHSGSTTVNGGVLLVDGLLGSGSVTVNSGAYLSGSGTMAGAVSVVDGGHLSLASGSVMSLGSLVLNNDSNVDVALAAAIPGAAGLANVAGNLTLDGKLNVSNAGGFGAGVYRLFDYGGLLTNNGLVIGTTPNGVLTSELDVQTNVTGQVNLVAGGPFNVRFWDGSELSGNGRIEGGNGTWNSTATNWTGANGNLNSAWLDTFAVFQGASGFVNLTSAQRVTGLQFVTSGYNLYGSGAGELVLVNDSNGATNVRVDSGVTADLDVNISGAGTLNKLDSGTLVLNGSNSYSGGTLLAGGRLVVGNDNALGSGSLRVTTDASFASNRPVRLANDVILDADLTFNGAGALTLDGAISGSKGLIKEGAMTTLVLNGSSSYAGDTVLNAGTLRLGHNDALGDSVLKVTGSSTLQTVGVTTLGNRLQIDDSLTFSSADNVSLSGRLGGSGVLTKTGTGTLTLSGTNDFLGQMNISTGQVTLQGITGLGVPSVNLQSGSVLKVAADSTLNQLTGSGNVELANSTLTVNGGGLGGSFSGSGHLTKVGNGSLILAGNSAIGGSLTVSGGSVILFGSNVVFSASAVNVASGASLIGFGGAAFDSTVNVADGASLGLVSGNTMTTGALNLSANSILAASLGAPVDGAPGLLRVNGNLVLDGKLNVSDIGGFGMGVYRLIDYTGTLTDNGLSVGIIPSGLAISDLEVQTSTNKQVNLVVGGAAGNVLFWDGNTTSNGVIEGGSGTWGGPIKNWTTASGNFNQAWLDGAFVVFQGTAGSVTVDGLQNTSGLQFLSDGYTLSNGTGGGLNLINSVAGFTGVRVGSGNTATLAVDLSGSGTLNKLEGGTLVLTGNNSYQGGTSINGGTVQVDSDARLGAASGALSLNGGALQTTANTSTQRQITLGANGGSFRPDAATTLTINSGMQGTGGLTQGGAGTLVLTGSNSYAGDTTIEAGTLQLGNGGISGTLGAGNVFNNGALLLDRSDAYLIANSISGTGSLTQQGTGAVALTGDNSYSGQTTIASGTLQVGAGGNSGSLGTGAVTNNGVLSVLRRDAVTLAQNISGSGSLQQLGSGTTTLTGSNSYTGGTVVVAGTLRAGSSGALVQNTAYHLNQGATLDLNGHALLASVLTGGGNLLLGSANLTINNAAGQSTEFDGQIAGTGQLVKQGEGVLALNNASSFAGGVSLKQGRINLGNAQGLGTGSLAMDDGTSLALTANGMAIANNLVMTGSNDPVIDTGANSAIWAGAISGTGFLTKQGSGVLALSSTANNYTGATQVAQGTLQAAAVNSFSSSSAHSVAAGAVLDLAGYSQSLSSLSNSGTVNLSRHGGGTPGAVLKLTGPYVGNNGTLGISTVLAADGSASDKLLLSGADAVASGTTAIQITNAGGLGAQTTGSGIQVVATENGARLQPGSFALAGGHVDAGAYEYRLFQTAQGAALQSINTQLAYRSEVPLISALPAQLRQADAAMLGDLRKRMGDDNVTGMAASGTFSSDTGSGRRAWGRILRADPTITQQGTVNPQSSGHLTGFQAGLDLYAGQSFKGGFYVGQLQGDMSVTGFAGGINSKYVGFNSLTSRYLGLYGTWQSANGLYADAVLQAADYRSTLHTSESTGASGSSIINGTGVLASLELGQSFAVGSHWQIEPQTQISYRSINLHDSAMSLAQVQNKADNDWTLRLGARIKGSFATGAGHLQPYARVNVYKASSTNDAARFITSAATTQITAKGGYTSTEVAAGASLQLNKSTSIYGELGKLWAVGGDSRIKSGVQASLGVRVQW